MRSDNAQDLFSSSSLRPNLLLFTKSCMDGKLCVCVCVCVCVVCVVCVGVCVMCVCVCGIFTYVVSFIQSLASNTTPCACLYSIPAIIHTTQPNATDPILYQHNLFFDGSRSKETYIHRQHESGFVKETVFSVR
jgi:hypothetical protein